MILNSASYSKSRALIISKRISNSEEQQHEDEDGQDSSREHRRARRKMSRRKQAAEVATLPSLPSRLACCQQLFSSTTSGDENQNCRLICSASTNGRDDDQQAQASFPLSNPSTTTRTASNSSAKKITNVNNRQCCWLTVKHHHQRRPRQRHPTTSDHSPLLVQATRWPITALPQMFTSLPSFTMATILVTATLLLITSSASFTSALETQQQQQQQQQQQLEAKAEALISQVGGGTNMNTNVQAGKTIPMGNVVSGGDSSSQNVIVIKYANVTRNDNDPADQVKLNVFQLHNEPLSVPFIESKFSHSIQSFDVSQNQLSTLSKDLFCPLSNEVRQLNISHNLLENFDCLGLISQAGQLCLSELRILDMSFNLVKHLPATGVATLHNLEVLNLSNNLIESLDELSLSSLFKLTRLDLSNNRIQQLPLRIFHKSTSMQVLRLQANHLQTHINQLFLSGLISLEELDLSFNNITHISDLAFLDKPNLTRVDLSHNLLNGLRQEALRVTQPHLVGRTNSNQLLVATSPSQQQPSYKTRLHHNGQYATSTSNNYPRQQQQQQQQATATTSVEFYLSSNPFVCDCQLEWMRKYQPAFVSRQALLSSSKFNGQQHHQADHLSLSEQLVQLQNDQPTVIQQQQQQQQTPSSASDSNNNISENVQSSQQSASSVSSSSSSSSSGGSNHHGRIADLDQIKCSPLYKRNSQIRQQRMRATSTNAPSADSNSHHAHHHSLQVHHPNNHLHQQQQQQHHHHHNNRMQTDLISSAAHQVHHQQQQQQSNTIDLLTADSSNFLCRYKSHCFALCHCCEFDACDCEMICPTGCNCYYDLTWQTNIIDCSSNNHTVVPDRIPMDVSGLYLDGNNIDSLRPSNLIARKSLKTLYLNSSNLQFIANRTFNGLIELQTLYLNDNQLRTLNGHEFEPLAQLRALFLQSNRLDHISNQTFIYLRSLEVLDLSNNRLTSINIDLFMSIGHHNIRLSRLNIAHNWWSCQCSSINRFRQILKQKFLLNGGVNIADRNQLRCYYNSTTVGPLILDSTAYGGGGASSSSSPSAQQQPIFASFPQLASSLSGSQQLQNNRQQQQQQQQQLTEINQCSEMVEDRPDWLVDVNPPVIQPQGPAVINNNNEFSVESGAQNEQPNQASGFSEPNSDQSPLNGPYQPPPSVISDQPMFVPTPVAPPVDLLDQQPYDGFSQRHHHHIQPAANTMSLSAFLLLCAMCLCVIIIAISIFVFIRQQQQRFNHKRSSAASTTSGSSGASSAAAISALGPKIHHHHHTLGLNQPNYHHQQHHPHHTLHQHHLIMGSNAQVISPNQQHPMQHNLSASSQSNIYAALVSPTTGNSTIVTNGSNNGGAGATSGGPMFHHYHHRQPSNTASNANNFYSNSSTTASHHSKSSSTQHHAAQQQQQQQQQLASGGNYSSAANNNQWQQQIYGQSAPFGHFENPYEASQSVTYKASINSGVHPTSGSLYNALDSGKCQEVGGVNISSDWIRLPKVKQFMSKLVNKSLALGGYRSAGSRDELSAITSDKIYDAFLSYDKRDEQFVMQQLSAELEYGQPQYRVADRFRDLPLPSSAYIAEAITSVIGCSHRTIIVLTENYLTSELCRYELQAALREAAIDKSHKIIAVVLNPNCLLEMDNEMRALLTNSPVQFVQPQQQLVQLDGSSGNGSPASSNEQQQHQFNQQQLVATLTNQSGGNQQVCTQTTQLATQRITFINYNERKFWTKIKQLMPVSRPSTQTLTLTTKN